MHISTASSVFVATLLLVFGDVRAQDANLARGKRCMAFSSVETDGWSLAALTKQVSGQTLTASMAGTLMATSSDNPDGAQDHFALGPWSAGNQIQLGPHLPSGSRLDGRVKVVEASGTAVTDADFQGTLPAGLAVPAGGASFFLLLVADGSQQQPETDVTNNVRMQPFEVVAPDLWIETLGGPASPGQRITVTWSIADCTPARTGPIGRSGTRFVPRPQHCQPRGSIAPSTHRPQVRWTKRVGPRQRYGFECCGGVL